MNFLGLLVQSAGKSWNGAGENLVGKNGDHVYYSDFGEHSGVLAKSRRKVAGGWVLVRKAHTHPNNLN